MLKIKTKSQLHKNPIFQRCSLRRVDIFFEVLGISMYPDGREKTKTVRTKSLTEALEAIEDFMKLTDPKQPKKSSPKSSKSKRKPKAKK